MKLYIYEHCPFCCRARMIFGLKGLPLDTEVVMEGDAETPIRLIGKKGLPILQKDDGSHMAESLDIVHHVDGLDGQPLLAAAPDGRIQAWYDSAWPLALKLFIPRFTRGHFAELATAEARVAYRLREEKAFGDLDALMAQSPALISEMDALLADLEPLLADRAGLDRDDILLYPLLRSLSIVRGLDFGPYATAYMGRLELASGVPLLLYQAS